MLCTFASNPYVTQALGDVMVMSYLCYFAFVSACPRNMRADITSYNHAQIWSGYRKRTSLCSIPLVYVLHVVFTSCDLFLRRELPLASCPKDDRVGPKRTRLEEFRCSLFVEDGKILCNLKDVRQIEKQDHVDNILNRH